MLLSWIWFAELKHIPLLHKHRLLEHFSDPQTLYDTSDAELKRLGVSDQYRKALQEKDVSSAQKILKDCNQKGIGILTVQDEAYPERLRHIPDAPLVLYYRGLLPRWDSYPVVGMVGTRKYSAYGLQVARQMGYEVAASGAIVASGGARGGDAAGMEGALQAGGAVVSVMGSGVDVLYPPQNRRLFEKVLKTGCLISEYPPGEKGLPWHFPERNRIISGISSGVLVVEEPQKSGALITARYAMEQGRDVFVVPGNIDNASCVGSNLLLQEGAMPVFSGWDVLENYEFLYPGKLKKQKQEPFYVNQEPEMRVAERVSEPTAKSENGTTARKNSIDNRPVSTYSVLENKKIALCEDEQAVMALLTHVPQEPADLMAKLSMPSGKVLSTLTMLSIKGLVQKHPGGRVSLK